jgi:hypothetical protein
LGSRFSYHTVPAGTTRLFFIYHEEHRMDDSTPMPFGMHKGKPLVDVPPSYLLWAYDNLRNMDPELRQYIDDNREALETEAGTDDDP